MTLDVARVRARFPSLTSGAAHFDGPGGTQTPDVVADAVRAALVSDISNRGAAVTASERQADAVVLAARDAMGDLLATDPAGVVFGRSMTQLTFDLARTLARGWGPGDEVVVSRLDHDGNVRPWVIAAEAAGATVRWIDFDPSSSELTVAHVEEQIGDRTRLVAVTGASNLLGTRPPLVSIVEAVRASSSSLVFVDGVHLTPHAPVDLGAVGADFYACSPYKFFGPHCGVLAARPELLRSLEPHKLLPQTDAVPERYELGTLPYELLAGVTAAVDFIAGLDPEATGGRPTRIRAGLDAADAHETRLRIRLEEELGALPGVTQWARASSRTPTLLFTFETLAADDAYRHLAGLNVNAPAGTFYAYEPSMRLGLGTTGGLRVGLAPYNDDAEVDRLVAGLAGLLRERQL